MEKLNQLYFRYINIDPELLGQIVLAISIALVFTGTIGVI